MADQDATVEEELERAARVAFAVAAQSADRLARARQELARQAQHRSEQEYRQLEARYRSEAAIASARLSAVERPEWWNRAELSEVAAMHDLAQQWREHDPRAGAAAETIAREVRDRYGIDLANPGADSYELRAALARLELDRASQSTARDGGAGEIAQAIQAVQVADRRDARAAGPADAALDAQATDRGPDVTLQHRAADLELQATELETLAGQGGTDRSTPDELRAMATESRTQAQQYPDEAAAAESAPGKQRDGATTQPGAGPAAAAPAYDSDERRDATAGRMREHGVPEEAIAVAMRADVAQGRPASDAPSSTRRTVVPSTRQTAGRTHITQRQDRSR